MGWFDSGWGLLESPCECGIEPPGSKLANNIVTECGTCHIFTINSLCDLCLPTIPQWKICYTFSIILLNSLEFVKTLLPVTSLHDLQSESPI